MRKHLPRLSEGMPRGTDAPEVAIYTGKVDINWIQASCWLSISEPPRELFGSCWALDGQSVRKSMEHIETIGRKT